MIDRNTLFAAAFAASAGFAANAGAFELKSADIAEGDKLADAFVFNGFGCTGGDMSPALAWFDAPAGTKSFVISAYDPDAPTGSGWWHWNAFNIPADVTSVARGAELPAGVIEARNDYGVIGFGGACPPPGEVHRYVFTVWALGVERLDLDASATNAVIGFMTRANALASASITAVYTR